MRFYPMFFPKHDGVMCKESDFEDINCMECGKPFMECCRTSESLWCVKRFIDCSSTICKIGTRTLTGDGGYNHDVYWIPVKKKFRFMPFNWRAALMGATYSLPDKDRAYIKQKQTKTVNKLNKMLEINPEPEGKELMKAKQLYRKIGDLESILRMY